MRLFILLLTFSVYSQNNFESIDNFIYDYNKQIFEIWVKDSIYEFDLNKNLIDRYDNPLYSTIDISAIQTIYGHKNELLAINGSGNIFKNENRIDNSNIDSFFTNSITFEYNDTLFKLGGYGYWTKFKGIIYLDKNQKTWESFYLTKIDEKYKGILSPKISNIDNHQYLIYGGKTFDDRNPLNEETNMKVYLLDMFKKQISKYGDSKSDFQGRKVESKDLILNKRGITKLDWRKNKMSYYLTSWTSKVDLNSNIYLVNNEFYFIEEKDRLFNLSSSPNEIQNLKVYNSNDIIRNDNKQVTYVVLICLILLGFIFIYKKYNTISIGKDKMMYRFKSISISRKDHQILCEIIKNNNITTNQIHKFIKTNDLHPNHIYRLIPETMSDIEKSIKILTNSNQSVFSISKNKMDRRIKEYRLNPHYRIKN